MKRRFLTVLSLLGALTPLASAAADPQLLQLVMPDAKIVSGVSVDSVMLTPFGQFILSQLPPTDDGMNLFITVTGFDPRRDIHEIVIASQADPGKKAFLLLARATFDGARILSVLQQQGMKTDSYRGVPTFSPDSKRGAASTPTFAFVNDSILVAGDPDSVHGAIDRRSASSALDPLLSSLIATSSANQDLWVASIVPISSLASIMGKGKISGLLQGDVIKGINQTSAGAKFGDTVEVRGILSARNEQDAASLAGVVSFFGNMLQSQPPTGAQPAVNMLVRQMSVKTDANAVTLSLSIPEAELETLFKMTQHRTLAQR
jgi:hypothetical protein